MSSPEDRARHSRRLKKKVQVKRRSQEAKELSTKKYRQRVVEDKKGREHDLGKMNFRQLIEAIQEDDE
jgi:hypothetical protein